MNSKKKSLLLAAAVLLVLALCLTALLATGGKDTLSGPESAPANTLLQSDQAVSSIAIQTPDESYTILKQEGGSEQQVQWGISDLDGIEQSQTKYSDLAAVCTNLTYTQKLETPKELSVYGLVSPSANAAITYEDGSEQTLLVGDITPDEAAVYCKLASDDSVYIISLVSGQKFTRTLLSYVELTLVPNLSSDSGPGIEAFSMERFDGGVSYTAERREGTGEEDGDLSPLWLTSPEEKQLSQTQEKTLLALVSSFSADSTAAIRPSASQLKEYGFENPTARVRYTIDGQTYTITIGGGIDYTPEEDTLGLGGTGSYYIQLEGRDVVYTASLDNLGWLNLRY